MDEVEQLDLSLNKQQESVYASGDESTGSIMSERVQSLATSVYAEFERLIPKYGQDVLENIMPLVVNLLEQLDSAYCDNNEQSVELELISEDNEQLITQYEREKQLRKLAEAKYLEYEDAQDLEKRNINNELEALEHTNKQLESKVKNLQDHVDRTEDRLAEQKKEYHMLSQRHSEMLQSFMERVDHQSKFSPAIGSSSGTPDNPFRFPKRTLGVDHLIRFNMSSSQPDLATSSPIDSRSPYLRSTNLQSTNIPGTLIDSEERNALSIEDEPEARTKDKVSNLSVVKNLTAEFSTASDGDALGINNLSPSVQTDMSTSTSDLSSGLTPDASMSAGHPKLAAVPENAMLSGDDNRMLTMDASSVSQLNDSDVFTQSSAMQSSYGQSDQSIGSQVHDPMHISSEARAIIQSTPELMISSERHRVQRQSSSDTNSLDGESIESDTRSARERMNNLSLFAELSMQEPSAMTELEKTGDMAPVGRELETLIRENESLRSTKNKFSSQKNELLKQVEELSSDTIMMQDELDKMKTLKSRMKLRVSELEHDLKKTKHELEKTHIALKNKGSEDRSSSANRKRFTRVEMARVLMERNQYKERLMELQEAVRWTEMIRASKENHLAALHQKKKSSIWKLFSNLFASSATPASMVQRKSPQQPISIWYGAGQMSPPSNRRHNVGGSQTHRYSGEIVTEGLTEKQRLERRERYKYVKEHISADGRMQAYGWSLPANYNCEDEAHVPVPVPVYCRPLNTDPAMKIWCAAGIDLTGGKTADGSFIGCGGNFKPPTISTVWVGTSTHSCSRITIIDSNSPTNALDQFIVCSSHLLCMSAVPGVTETDYPINDVVDGNNAGGPAKDLKKFPVGRSYSMSSASDRVYNDARPSREVTDMIGVRRNSSISEQRALYSPTECLEMSSSVHDVQTEEESYPDEADSTDGSTPSIRCTSALPTVWLGSQSGKLYVHSSVVNSRKCLQSTKLKDSVLSIVHVRGRVLAALADGTVAIFHRKPDGRWDLSNYHILDLGRPHHSIRCMTAVHDRVWCGYRNRIQVINPVTMKIEKSFDAHPRRESQVRQLAWCGDGVWVSIRLDSTLRLYNATTYHHLQDVDIEPYVSKILGTGKLGFSFVRITSLLLTADRLWVGTGNGVTLTLPLVGARPTREDLEPSVMPGNDGEPRGSVAMTTIVKTSKQDLGVNFMPYCSMTHGQLCFHGHRDSVKFFVSVPGCPNNVSAARAYTSAGAPPPDSGDQSPSLQRGEGGLRAGMLVISGGEGYVDFRVGDDDSDGTSIAQQTQTVTLSPSKVVASERSHLIVWHVGDK